MGVKPCWRNGLWRFRPARLPGWQGNKCSLPASKEFLNYGDLSEKTEARNTVDFASSQAQEMRQVSKRPCRNPPLNLEHPVDRPNHIKKNGRSANTPAVVKTKMKKQGPCWRSCVQPEISSPHIGESEIRAHARCAGGVSGRSQRPSLLRAPGEAQEFCTSCGSAGSALCRRARKWP